jgi:acetyl esterase/lipase
VSNWQATTQSLFALACSAVATIGLAAGLVPFFSNRLGFYGLLASASILRLTLLAGLASLLAAPAARRSRLARVAFVGGALSAAVGGVAAASVIGIARSRGDSISLTESLFGVTALDTRPEIVTFASGEEWQLQADLYRPPHGAGRGDELLPSVVVVHGGGWRYGDKGENQWWNQWLAARGYLVLDIQYRLAPGADWRQATADVQAGIAWIREHATELAADPQRVALLGRSAGGHLALLAAYGDEVGRRPASVIALYAPTDLGLMHAQAGGDLREAIEALVRGDPATAAADYRLASPVSIVSDNPPPTLLIHGTSDEVVRVEHSRVLARVLEERGASIDLVVIPFIAPHAFDHTAWSPAAQLAREAVAGFLATSPSRVNRRSE